MRAAQGRQAAEDGRRNLEAGKNWGRERTMEVAGLEAAAESRVRRGKSGVFRGEVRGRVRAPGTPVSQGRCGKNPSSPTAKGHRRWLVREPDAPRGWRRTGGL